MTITDTYTEELAIDLTGSALLPARKGMDVQRIDGEDGSLLVEFSATSSGCLFELVGKNGRLSVDVDADRLLGRIDLNGETRSLDAEDALGMADGTIHSVGLTADETGTHLFADGYETFSATLRVWCQDLGATNIVINPSGVLDVRRFKMWNSALSLQAMAAKAPTATPFVEFAGSELSARDARRTGELTHGALRARTRLRGKGQGGTVLAAQGSAGELSFEIVNGDLLLHVEVDDEPIAHVRAPGKWDDGNWHDLVAISGRGAIDLYVDGFLVAHEPGEAFFADLGKVERVTVGKDLEGARLFGEAQTASIFSSALTDAQVKRLANVAPLRTQALFDTGYLGSKSYRIPSLIRLDSGSFIAGADQRVSIANDSPNDINFVIRRSEDGRRWDEAQIVLEYPGEGALGASVIDSVLFQDHNSGRVFCLIDQFPGGVGQPNAEPGSGFDEQGRQLLFDRDATAYVIDAEGIVTTESGEPTDYTVDETGNVFAAGAPAGNIHLATGVDPHESLLTLRTCNLILIHSDDDGRTWSRPINLNPALKQPWMRFLGTSPGNGIQLEHGTHRGRLLAPVYYNHEEGKTFSCAAVYSDDEGQTWNLGKSPNDERELFGKIVSSRHLNDDRGSTHESALVETPDGVVHSFMRNQHPSGRVAHAASIDGGETWGEVTFVEQLTEIFSQPNAISVRDECGTESVVFANASMMLPFRGCGVLRQSFDGGKTWPHNRVLNPRHHVYQCMTQRDEQTLLVLWEREWQGLFLTEVPLSWLTTSRSTLE